MLLKRSAICVGVLLAAGCGQQRSASADPSARDASKPASQKAQTPSPKAPPKFPLSVSKDGRYLVDQDNTPFRIQGDSAQSLIANLTYAEADAYFSDRRARGFNTVNINLIVHKFMEGVKAAGAAQLWAGDWNAPTMSTDVRAFAADMDLNAVYTSGVQARPGTTYEQARIAYEYSPPHPAYLKETGYEDEGWVPGDAASVRKYEYWAIL